LHGIFSSNNSCTSSKLFWLNFVVLSAIYKGHFKTEVSLHRGLTLTRFGPSFSFWAGRQPIYNSSWAGLLEVIPSPYYINQFISLSVTSSTSSLSLHFFHFSCSSSSTVTTGSGYLL
jgi:hypothetical protein